MSDRMRPLPFGALMEWLVGEIGRERTIFGIPQERFFKAGEHPTLNVFGRPLDHPIGPAAGPHTQLAQNIVAAFLAGGRFFELKTVQQLDGEDLKVEKPCIAAPDEGYNVEWSTELTVQEAFEDYVKAWFALHLLAEEYSLSPGRGFIFNMSVGYDLEGIRSPKIDAFLNHLIDASGTAIWQECRDYLLSRPALFKTINQESIHAIPSRISNSVTLSTLHGCPSAEIERIARHLMGEKGLHTFVKLNPTLLGYSFVRETMDRMGYGYLDFDEHHFQQDLQYDEAVPMLVRLRRFAAERGLLFGVKLSNTFPVKITRRELPGEEMYMSGRALFPLTVHLAARLAHEFRGDLAISYSGGADAFNLGRLYETGIWPITVATTLLKPGGYLRLGQMAEILAGASGKTAPDRVDPAKLRSLAQDALSDPAHLKGGREVPAARAGKQAPLVDCFEAPCRAGCPIGQDIPEYLRLVDEGRYLDALQVIVSRNPLPFTTGTLCHHRCMGACTRTNYEEPVQIRAAKLLAAEQAFDALVAGLSKPAITRQNKVAVIGAGPAGLSAAFFLRRAGFAVTVLDRRAEPGGLIGQVIPGFRGAKEAIRRDLVLIQEIGVELRLGAGTDFSVEALKREGYRYIFIAIGAQEPMPLPLEEGSDEVLHALEFLAYFNAAPDTLQLGRNVAVIGGGNSAMDAARAAKRCAGVTGVFLIYRRTREYMPADPEELRAALADGVEFRELLAPVSFARGVLRCQRMELGAPDASGRRSPVPVPGVFLDVAADSVIAAVGERIDPEPLRRNGVALDARGRATVDPATNETNVPDVFIGGDALRGPATIAEAVSDGLRFAQAVAAKEQVNLKVPETPHRPACPERAVTIAGRRGRLRLAQEVRDEGRRCLECDLVCNICVEVCPNRANVTVSPGVDGLDCHNQVIHVDGMCNECGNCATFCPHGGAPYRDKLTLYWRPDDFESGGNNGFIRLDEAAKRFRVRLDGRIMEITLGEHGRRNSEVPGEIADLIRTVCRDYGYLFAQSLGGGS